ncbi:hypothetical protein AB0M02_33210 [Actinoplanes sp. NPDC051861]|uniref:hypothetical protein n=1 Tax=Actinoplanes sp. NPDC051861 TaxID=3155170 RepID=UPI00341B61E9
MRKRRPHVLAVLAAIFTLVVTAAPPAAAAPVPWNMAPCVLPRFDDAYMNVAWVVMAGSATECDPQVADSGFRLATYFEDQPVGISEGYNVRLFPPDAQGPTGTNPRSTRDFAAAVLRPENPGEYGVCLLAGANERKLCARVEVWIGGDGAFHAGAKETSVNDPLVTKPVQMGIYEGEVRPPGEPWGICGTCY